MKKKLAALALGSLMLCALSVPALAEGEALPDSVLCCGEVTECLTGPDGALTGLRIDSPDSGEIVLHLSDRTVWIDGDLRTAADPGTVKTGERLYVFHSPVTTRSLPPQSAAFAVVRNVSQDAACPRYLKVEAVEEQEGRLRITTDSGGLYLFADRETGLSAYAGDAPAGPEDIRAGSHIMAWYSVVALSYPGQAHPSHIMTLEDAGDAAPLTRAGFLSLLHTAAGSPAADGALSFSDVSPDAPYAQAVRWAVGEGIFSGHSGGEARPDDPLTREQMAVLLWRRAGSPMLMDYPGLTGYGDAGDISRFAQPALAWAHQRGLLPAGDRLGPRETVTAAEAQAVLAALDGQARG